MTRWRPRSRHGVAALAVASAISACSVEHPGDVAPQPVEVHFADDGIDLVTTARIGTVSSGKVLVTATNHSEAMHELVLLRGSGPQDLVTTGDGAVDESQLDLDELVGRIGQVARGRSGTVALDLTPGTYTIFCNVVVERPDGTRESHFAKGMAASFIVADASIR